MFIMSVASSLIKPLSSISLSPGIVDVRTCPSISLGKDPLKLLITGSFSPASLFYLFLLSITLYPSEISLEKEVLTLFIVSSLL